MKFNPFDKFNKDWALVTAGNSESFNSMTISWGSMGTIWGKDIITIYIRPERYTFDFLNTNEYFTVSFYDKKYRDALNIMGTVSGRDTDKVKQSNLTPLFLNESVTYEQASETYLCRKIYMKQMQYEDLPDFAKNIYEGGKQLHYIIIGEVVKVS